MANLSWGIQLLGLPFILDSVMRIVLVWLRFLRSPGPAVPPGHPLEGGAIVLIAARDEEGTIGPTVRAVAAQLDEWPGSGLWVVADHCRDETATEAAAAGAMVAERLDGEGGKGAVIEWWLESHPEAWLDSSVIVILDADSRLLPGSLSHLRRAMANGADGAQAFVSPLADSRSGRLAGWSEVLMQQLDDRARGLCGWAVPLRGTGMALRCQLLAELSPRLHTQAEDLELDVLLTARGARIDFVPEAILYDPKPQRVSGVSRQRARWFMGQIEVLRDYRREIWRALTSPTRRSRLDNLFLLLPLFMRPKVAMIGLRILLLPVIPAVALCGLSLDLAYYLAGVRVVERPRQYLSDLLSVPVYVAMWGYGFVLALLHRGRRIWLRAGR